MSTSGTLDNRPVIDSRAEVSYNAPHASKNHLLHVMSDRIAVLEDALLVQCSDGHALLSPEKLRIRRIDVGSTNQGEVTEDVTAEHDGIVLLDRENAKNTFGYTYFDVSVLVPFVPSL